MKRRNSGGLTSGRTEPSSRLDRFVPRRIARLSIEKQSFAPRAGLPQKCQSAEAPPAPLFLWEQRPRGECAVLPAQKQKLRPGVGAPTKKEPKRHPHRFSCGSRAPAANAAFCPLKSKSFAPEGGAPTERLEASS